MATASAPSTTPETLELPDMFERTLLLNSISTSSSLAMEHNRFLIIGYISSELPVACTFLPNPLGIQSPRTIAQAADILHSQN